MVQSSSEILPWSKSTMSKKVRLLMLVLQMLTREKSRNLLRQKQGKEEIIVNHKFQGFVRKLLEDPHVKSAGLLGLKISFCHRGIERLFLVRFKKTLFKIFTLEADIVSRVYFKDCMLRLGSSFSYSKFSLVRFFFCENIVVEVRSLFSKERRVVS